MVGNINSITNSSRNVDIFYDPDRLGQKGKNSGFVVTEEGKNFPVIIGDGNFKTEKDALKTVKGFLNKGYQLENIRINGQPVQDTFEKTENKFDEILENENIGTNVFDPSQSVKACKAPIGKCPKIVKHGCDIILSAIAEKGVEEAIDYFFSDKKNDTQYIKLNTAA